MSLIFLPTMPEHPCSESLEESSKFIAGHIQAGNCVAIRSFFTHDEVRQWLIYLSRLARSSLPAYHPIAFGSPNHHRLNLNDERSAVPGFFHQFNFFPWNQDVLDIHNRCAKIFILKEQVSLLLSHSTGASSNQAPAFEKLDSELINRVSFQYYHRGHGQLALHRDPLNKSQRVVPTIVLSQHMEDYFEGGFYYLKGPKKVFPEKHLSPGDILFFDISRPHGVDTIDISLTSQNPILSSCYLTEDTTLPGRWMALVTTTRPSTSSGAQGDVVP